MEEQERTIKTTVNIPVSLHRKLADGKYDGKGSIDKQVVEAVKFYQSHLEHVLDDPCRGLECCDCKELPKHCEVEPETTAEKLADLEAIKELAAPVREDAKDFVEKFGITEMNGIKII